MLLWSLLQQGKKEMVVVVFDTNLIIALINHHDRLHSTARGLADKEDVFLLNNVKMEARNAFLRKFNSAMLEVYKILNSARKAEDELQFQGIVVEGFQDLIKKRQEYKSFYEYIYTEIQNIGITMESVTIIPKILNEKAIELVSNILSPKK